MDAESILKQACYRDETRGTMTDIKRRAHYRKEATRRQHHWDRAPICPGCSTELRYSPMKDRTLVVCPSCSWHKVLPYQVEPGKPKTPTVVMDLKGSIRSIQ